MLNPRPRHIPFNNLQRDSDLCHYPCIERRTYSFDEHTTSLTIAPQILTLQGLIPRPHFQPTPDDPDIFPTMLNRHQNPFDHLYRDSDVEGMTDGFDERTAYGAIDWFDDPAMGWSRHAQYYSHFNMNSGGCPHFGGRKDFCNSVINVHYNL